MTDESLVTLTSPQFEELMQTQGLTGTVQGVLDIANEELETDGVPLTLDNLGDGTHPLLDKLSRYQGLAPDDRKISQEEVLTLFTNVEDFGKYDPQDEGSAKLRSAASGAARVLPETIGAGAGFKAGLAAAGTVAAFIPPAGLPGLAARGLVYGVGGLGGSILGAMAAGRLEDDIVGEAAPVLPSLEASNRFGEAGTMALSLLASPWKLITNIPKAKTGAIEFLENFKNISSGKFVDVADEAFQLYAKNAGLSDKAARKLFETASKARLAGSKKGPMFGGGIGVDIGLSRFNPAGFLLDPRKGTGGARVIGGIEGGIEKSMKFARENPKTFLGTEAAVAAGVGTGAAIAQNTKPYDDDARIVGEVLGSFVVPLPAQVAIDYAPDAIKGVFRTMKNWWGKAENSGKSEGILADSLKKDSAERIMTALQRSVEFEESVDAEGRIITADEKLTRFIKDLGESAKDQKLGADGKPYTPSVATLSEVDKLDFSPTLKTIENELAKSSEDLKVATGRGREELQAGAVNAVRALASTGDPTALAYAARIQQTLFEQNIVDQIEGPITDLTVAARKVVGRDLDGGSNRVDLSEKLYDVLDQQITLSKVRESRLWADVKSYPITEFYSRNGKRLSQPNILQLLDRSSKKGGLRYPTKGTNDYVKEAMGKYSADIEDLRNYFQNGTGRNPANADRFFDLRSGLLERASELRKNGRIKRARDLNKMADALLRDLTGQKDNVSEAYNTARAYTFARNNVFTRTFHSDLQVVDKNRGLALDPKQLLDKAFKGNNLSVARRYEQIRAGGQFLVDQGGMTAEEALVMDADDLMSKALRDSLSKVMEKKVIKNPVAGELGQGLPEETFVVNPKQLENWKKQPGTKELMALIPELELDLADAETAQKSFNNMLGDVANQMSPSKAAKAGFSEEQITRLYANKAFKEVLQFEDPGEAVTLALASEKPTIALRELYRMADEANYKDSDYTKDQALAGLKSAIFSSALRKANNKSGLPDGNTLQGEIFSQLKGADPSVKFSLKDFLIKNDLASEEEMADVQSAIKTLRGVEEAFATGDFENVLFKNPSLAKMFYLRIGGATAGGAVQSQLKKFLGLPSMSGGLIAEQTGSELFQRVLLRGPETQRIKVMTEMFSNPAMLAEMLKKVDDKKSADKAMSAIEKFISPLAKQVGRRIPIGIRAAEDSELLNKERPASIEDYEPPEEDQPNIDRMNAPRMLTFPPVRSTPMESSSGPAPSLRQPVSAAPQRPPVESVAPQRQAATQSGQVDRARFAALFPEDRELMGIGSLMENT